MGSFVNFKSAGAVIAAGAFFFASGAAFGGAVAEPDWSDTEYLSLAEAASSNLDLADPRLVAPQFSTAFSRLDGKPAEGLSPHEGKASALWTGRRFQARGRIIDSRASDTKFERAAAGTAPDGWSLAGDKLVHRESGLECPASFTLKGREKERILALDAITAYDRRGRDVSCNYVIDGDAAVTIYASYYPTMTLDEHAAGAVAAIRQSFDVRGELPVTVIEVESKSKTVSTEPLPTALSGAFDIGEINGVPYKTSIWLAKSHGWHVKARATYAQADFTSEIVAAVLFGVNYVNVDMKNRADPTGAGPEV